jgi:hypothetical protein
MKNLILVCFTLMCFADGRDESEPKPISELWQNVVSHPKFNESGEMHQEAIDGDVRFLMSAKQLNVNTIVVCVSRLKNEDAKRFTKEFRDKRTVLGSRALFQMLLQEREEMNSNALDCLASHESNRIALFKKILRK